MRVLSFNEMALVSGGEDQVVVVTGTRMTDAEKAAYDQEQADRAHSADCWFHGGVDKLLDWFEEAIKAG